MDFGPKPTLGATAVVPKRHALYPAKGGMVDQEHSEEKEDLSSLTAL